MSSESNTTSSTTSHHSNPVHAEVEVDDEEPVAIMIANDSSVSHSSFSGAEGTIHGCTGSDEEETSQEFNIDNNNNTVSVCIHNNTSGNQKSGTLGTQARATDPNEDTAETIYFDKQRKCDSQATLPQGKVNINSSTRRGPCCICSAPALYTCPGCNRSTCCISCSRSHKALMNCTGMPDPAVKVTLNEFTDRQLQRDFNFLEDCRRVLDNIERTTPSLISSTTTSPAHKTNAGVPREAKELHDAARQRGWLCQITSSGMRKREANTSYWSRSDNTIFWRCDFHFYTGKEVEFTLSTVSDERYRLRDMLQQCWRKELPPFSHSSLSLGATAITLSSSSNSLSVSSLNTAVNGSHAKGKAFPSSSTSLPSLSVTVDKTSSDVLHLETGELLSREEANHKGMMESFLRLHQDGEMFLLYKAERLGTRTLYVSLSLDSTLSQALHQVCFVTEYPSFMVVGQRDLPHFPLASSEDLLAMRKLLGSLLRQPLLELRGESRPNHPRRRRKPSRKEGGSENEANANGNYSNRSKRPREGPSSNLMS